MTKNQALHLIEQFSIQAPFAVWIADSRGIAVFANKRLHAIFNIPEKPSGAIGMNLFDDPGIKALNLAGLSEAVKKGEVIDEIIEIVRPEAIPTNVAAERRDPFTIRVVAYPLKSSAQKIENYVFLISDLTAAYSRRENIRRQMKDIEVFKSTRESRIEMTQKLEQEIRDLEKALRDLGAEPAK